MRLGYRPPETADKNVEFAPPDRNETVRAGDQDEDQLLGCDENEHIKIITFVVKRETVIKSQQNLF